MDAALHVSLTQQQDYQFKIQFNNPSLPPLLADEPSPLGSDQGPSPAELLGAAVCNCLSASLLFALRKFKNQCEPLRAEARVQEGRNTEGRLRIVEIAVDLHLGVPAEQVMQLERILDQFESFCTVTQSVRGSIAVPVKVFDANGALLKG